MTADEIIQAMSKRGLRNTGQTVEINFDLYSSCKMAWS
jgi:hypothetical protein